MAVSQFKTYISGEVLTASDLNSSLTTITNNGEDLAWPATKFKDLNGQEFILSGDGNDSITADTNGQIDFKIGGTDITSVGTEGFQGNADILLASQVFD